MKSKEEILQCVEEAYLCCYEAISKENELHSDIFEKVKFVAYESFLLGEISGFLKCLTENEIEQERYSKQLIDRALEKYTLTKNG